MLRQIAGRAVARSDAGEYYIKGSAGLVAGAAVEIAGRVGLGGLGRGVKGHRVPEGVSGLLR